MATCDILSEIDPRLTPNIACLQKAKRSVYGIRASDMILLVFERRDSGYILDAISASLLDP